MLMNAVFVLRVIDLMLMPRKVKVFSVSSQGRGNEQRRWSPHVSARLLQPRVSLIAAATLRISIYVHGCLPQTWWFLIMPRFTRRVGRVS